MKEDTVLGVSEEGFHQIAYVEWGSNSSELPPIICVHGLTRNSRDFDALSQFLSSKRRHIFCPDVAGRGNSSWFKNHNLYHFNQYVMDMATMIAKTQAKHVDWIGTSMGGIIGMMMAALPNSPIQRLILNDVGPQIPIDGLRRLAQYAGKQAGFKSKEEAKQQFKIIYSGFGPLTEQQWDDFTDHSIQQKGPNLYIAKVDPGINHPKSTFQMISDFVHHPHRSLEGIFYDIDLWSIWSNIRCPILVIHGTHSDILTPEIIQKMQRTHPDTEVYTIEDAGHAPALLEQEHHENIHRWLTSHTGFS